MTSRARVSIARRVRAVARVGMVLRINSIERSRHPLRARRSCCTAHGSGRYRSFSLLAQQHPLRPRSIATRRRRPSDRRCVPLRCTSQHPLSVTVFLKNYLAAIALTVGTVAGTLAPQAHAVVIGRATPLVHTRGTTDFYEGITNTADSDTRSVLFIAPANQAQGTKAPAIVMLHYDTGTPELQANLSRAGSLAQQGYWVILPPAIGGHWSDDPSQTVHDDVGFISAVIESAVKNHPIDATRISMTGFSNGGFMTQRMACERPDLIASAVSVAASMRTSLSEQCNPQRPVPMVYILGTADPLVPYNGANRSWSRASFISAAAAFSEWCGFSDCQTAATNTSNLPTVVRDGTTVTLTHNGDCKLGGEVDTYTINGGGHAWPGGNSLTIINPGIGRVSKNLDATQVVADFAKLWTTASTH
jgi:polyhydroxybutyrate depolymerase